MKKKEHSVRYTDEELRAMQERGESERIGRRLRL